MLFEYIMYVGILSMLWCILYP